MRSFSEVYTTILDRGQLVAPRGQKTLELTDAAYTLEPFDRFAHFPSRQLNLGYIKKELLWYLNGDRFDTSIAAEAKVWEGSINRPFVGDPWLNSNYGYYLFAQGGVDKVVKVLTADRDSRRALALILNTDHVYVTNHDVPCTVSLGFRVRGSELQLTVHMRSQDAIFGLGNDVPFFSFVQELVLNYLLPVYPDLIMGRLTVFVESLHVYERHWEKLKVLVRESQLPLSVPRLSGAAEGDALRRGDKDFNGDFTRWLNAA